MLENSTNKLVYEVKASKVFAFPVPFTSPSDISCYLETDVVGVELKLAAGEFTVESKSDYSAGADITLTIPLPVGKRLAIVRECPITQLTDFPEFGRFPASANEKALDKLTMICQQLWEELQRCIKLSITSGQNPQQIIEMILSAKDMSLTAAEGAATANASAHAAAMTVQTIWAEITGNDASAQEALEALKQAFEAAGSVAAAAAAGKADVNAASLAAVAEAEKQIGESRDASLAALSATTQDRTQELLALLAETTGAEGVVAVAVKAVEDAKNAAETAAGSVNATADNAIASINAATQVAGIYRDEAQAKAVEAATQAKQAGDSAATAYGYIAETLANKNASAESALKAAEEAAKAEIAANAAAGAAGEAATTAAQQSITLHNQRVDAHSNLFNGKADKEHTHTRSDITDLATHLNSNFAKYLPLAGGSMTGSIRGADGSDGLMLNAALDVTAGAFMRLFQADYADNPGGFQLTARNGSNIHTLKATTAGSLFFDGKDVERVNTKGAKYIRFDSGLQICWDFITGVPEYSGKVVTFPQPFNLNPTVVITPLGPPANALGVNHVKTTTFETSAGSLITEYAWYIAIGTWK